MLDVIGYIEGMGPIYKDYPATSTGIMEGGISDNDYGYQEEYYANPDYELLKAQIRQIRIKKEFEEAFNHDIYRIMFVLGILALGLGLGQYIRGIIGV